MVGRELIALFSASGKFLWVSSTTKKFHKESFNWMATTVWNDIKPKAKSQEVRDKIGVCLMTGMSQTVNLALGDNQEEFILEFHKNPPGVVAIAMASPVRRSGDLDRREQAVVAHMLNGRSTRQIAQRMKISSRAVALCRRSIMQKTGCRNDAQLGAWAVTAEAEP